jgi:hypothetical protein
MPRGYKNTIRDIFSRLIIQENGCAEWPQAKRGPKGYGAVTYQKKTHFAYKLIYEHFVGPVPEGMVLDHVVCNNPACCNFAHLEVVTPRENLMRGNSASAINSRKTHCPRGHLYSHRDKQGRVCRICLNERCKLRMRKVSQWKRQLKSAQTSPDTVLTRASSTSAVEPM